MFLTIFKFEFKYWLKNPAVYIYTAGFLFLSIVTMAGLGGILGEDTTGSMQIINSPQFLYSLFNFFIKMLLFLLPAVVGNSIYRDYRSNAHSILYSFPFTKTDYLIGKFLSSFIIVFLISLSVGAGFVIGTILPGVNNSVISSFDLFVYLKIYLIYIIPNLLLFGVIIFAIVTFSRNVYAGFISVIILLIIREVILKYFIGSDSHTVFSLIEPFGEAATLYLIKNRTIAEQNVLQIPFEGLIIFNRLIWLSVSSLIFFLVYKLFSFSQNAVTLNLNRYKSKPSLKNNFGSIIKINLSEVKTNFSFFQQIKASWKISNSEFKFIVTSWSFISVLIAGSLFVLFILVQIDSVKGTKLLPATWYMLALPVYFFSILINLLTFLYAGILIHRSKIYRMNELVDASPVSNLTLIFSKVLALVKMQILLLSVIMIIGILVQTYRGYFNYELTHYLFDLYGIHLVSFVIWALAAIFIQSLINNSYTGLFFLIFGSLGISELTKIGIDQLLLRFNQNPDPGFYTEYSDLSYYGHSLIPYFIYKFYWFIFGLILFTITLLIWKRGLQQTFKERFDNIRMRFDRNLILPLTILILIFTLTGFWIFKEQQPEFKIHSENEIQKIIEIADKTHEKYNKVIQPRITSVKVNMNIFPESLNFKSDGEYLLVNKSGKIIDTLMIRYAYDVLTKYKINKDAVTLLRDTIAHFDIYRLIDGLNPGDSLMLNFEVENIPNTILYKNSVVEKNGTFITSEIFPEVGYRLNNPNSLPSDINALKNHYRSFDSDYIDFETTVSTSPDQIAIAPGYIEKEWVDNGRRYFKYKSQNKVTNDYVYNSGKYEIMKDKWNDVNLEIYYLKGHEYNLKHLMDGLKASLEYNEKFFGPYQHKHARIIEYSRTQGDFAMSFANTIPYSEVNFMLDIDSAGLNLPFLGAAHELAHQWWGHQVIPADVAGIRMITESMAEYISLKVLEHKYGKDKANEFLEKALDIYLDKRKDNSEYEEPLMFNTGLRKKYIPYQKGSIVFNAMSEYIGEERFNAALKSYLEKVKYQNAPYTTSPEMVDFIKQATPDSLKYLIKDMFETVTFYDNKILKAETKELSNGKYQIDLEFIISKYRINETNSEVFSDNLGKTLKYTSEELPEPVISLPMNDYIEITIYGENKNGTTDEILFSDKIKIKDIHNKLTLEVGNKPVEAGIDPGINLIDIKPDDNRKLINFK